MNNEARYAQWFSDSCRLILFCVLIGVLSFSAGCSPQRDRAVEPSPSPVASSPAKIEESSAISPQVTEAVLTDIATRTQVERDRLQVTGTTAETWPNGCLGLAQPEEMCAQALVSGWRVEVSDGSQTWVYRSDRTGQNLRLEAN